METSKIQIKVGAVKFSGEGNQDWLTSQLDKVLIKLPELLQVKFQNNVNDTKSSKVESANEVTDTKLPILATWLKEKGSNQVKKFLATAAHIQLNGKKRVTTTEVNAALKNSHQSKLSNPSDCLLQNIKKGFCERTGSDFFVTVEGLSELGIK